MAKKVIVEKATGERYASKAAMKAHEAKETKEMQRKEALKFGRKLKK